jgi:hypothetical protein
MLDDVISKLWSVSGDVAESPNRLLGHNWIR